MKGGRLGRGSTVALSLAIGVVTLLAASELPITAAAETLHIGDRQGDWSVRKARAETGLEAIADSGVARDFVAAADMTPATTEIHRATDRDWSGGDRFADRFDSRFGRGDRAGLRLVAGYDFVFAQPRITNNVGLTQEDEDINGNVLIAPRTFDHDFELSSRIHMTLRGQGDLGLRGSWWSLDSDASTIDLRPAANGFGRISHPGQFDVDLSIVQPAERLTASSSVEMQTFDLEGTKSVLVSDWDCLIGAGLRYGEFDTDYRVQAFNTGGTLSGEFRRQQTVSGLGPTISLQTSRMATTRMRMIAGMRASLLLTDSETSLAAAEDVDLVTPFTTQSRVTGEDILPWIETRVMAELAGPKLGRGDLLLRGGVEAQWLSGLESAAGQNADVGVLSLFVGAAWVR